MTSWQAPSSPPTHQFQCCLCLFPRNEITFLGSSFASCHIARQSGKLSFARSLHRTLPQGFSTSQSVWSWDCLLSRPEGQDVSWFALDHNLTRSLPLGICTSGLEYLYVSLSPGQGFDRWSSPLGRSCRRFTGSTGDLHVSAIK